MVLTISVFKYLFETIHCLLIVIELLETVGVTIEDINISLILSVYK